MSYFWITTDPVRGKRYRTRYRLTEAEAHTRLIDPERVDWDALEVEPSAPMPSGTFVSGLVPPGADCYRPDGST